MMSLVFRILIGVGVVWGVTGGAGLWGKDGEKKKKLEEEPASILFANAVMDPGLAFLVLDGVDANAAGFGAGVVTGWVQFPAGDRKIEVEHQPLGKVVLKKALEAGSRQAFVAYRVMEDQSERGRPPRPTIGVVTLACDEKGGVAAGKRRVVLVNATAREEVVLDVGGERATLKRLKPETVTTETGGGFIVVRVMEGEASEAKGVDASSAEIEEAALVTLNVEEPVVSYVVVHETIEGGLGAVIFAGLAGGRGQE